MQRAKKVALVCSGGGSRGLAHLGVVDVLLKNNYYFDFYAGVSAGAIVTAALACGIEVKEVVYFLKTRGVLGYLFDFSKNNFGLLRGEKCYEVFKDFFGEKRIEDLKRPLYIGATDFSTGERIVLNKGLVVDAVIASISVPVLFEPFYHKEEGRWLVDGGLSQNFPLDIAIEKYEGETIFGVNVVDLKDKPEGFNNEKFLQKTKHLFEALQRTIQIFFTNQQTNFPKDDRVINIKPDLRGFSSWQIYKFEEMLEIGRKEAEKVLENLDH